MPALCASSYSDRLRDLQFREALEIGREGFDAKLISLSERIVLQMILLVNEEIVILEERIKNEL